MANTKKHKISSQLVGVSGEYFVAAELSKRGYLATLTQRNAKGIDVLVSNSNASRSAAIQVKTNQGYQDYWILTSKAENIHAPRLFYVFVNLDTPSGLPDYHVVPSKIVANYVKQNHAAWLMAPGKKGQAHKDNSMRKFHINDKKYLNNWDALDLGILLD